MNVKFPEEQAHRGDNKRFPFRDVHQRVMGEVFQRRRCLLLDLRDVHSDVRRVFFHSEKELVGLFYDRRQGWDALDNYLACFRFKAPVCQLHLWEAEAEQAASMSYVGKEGSRPRAIDGVQYWVVPKDSLVTMHYPGLAYNRVTRE